MSELRLTPQQANYLRATPVSAKQPNRIRLALRLVDANQQALADALGLSTNQLGRYLNGSDLLLSTAGAIAAAFGLTVTDLFPTPPTAKAKRRPSLKTTAKATRRKAVKPRRVVKAAA